RRRSGQRGARYASTASRRHRLRCATRTTPGRGHEAMARGTSLPTPIRLQPRPITSRTVSRVRPTMFPPGTERRVAMAVGTGDQAPEFDLEEAFDTPRLRLQDFRGKRNVLLVFHPFAFTPVSREEALDLQANLESFENAETEVILVSCDTSAARQA